jgi:hypothetical protein
MQTTQIYNPFEEINQRLNFLESQLTAIQPTPPQPIQELMTDDDLVRYIPNLSKGTLSQWRFKKYIPYELIGKRAFYRKSTIDIWLLDKKRHTIAERVELIRTKK